MQIEIDMTKLAGTQDPLTAGAFLFPEHQYPEPSAGTDGVSYPTIPTLKSFVLTTSIIALGTVSLGSPPIDAKQVQDLQLVFPPPLHTKMATAAERYAQLKQEIVASGVPVLNDEELRAEIRERKGVKSGPRD